LAGGNFEIGSQKRARFSIDGPIHLRHEGAHADSGGHPNGNASDKKDDAAAAPPQLP
jgi:hypothetical protein